METALKEIIAAIKESMQVGAKPAAQLDAQANTQKLDSVWLDKLLRRRNREMHDGMRHVAKKRLLPYYLDVKKNDPARWESWEVDEACEERLIRLLRAKPRRTASGVATVTVLTKPWPCSSDCVYCPNDVRMPKSYLADEPACQRAERNFFDPYLQVISRLRALEAMGHVTDKVELIVLGGTWSDYPESYQIWFMRELFRALNDASSDSGIDGDTVSAAVYTRRNFYLECGILCNRAELAQETAQIQRAINAGECSYNEAVGTFYNSGAWDSAAAEQHAGIEELEAEQRANEEAARRVVGLVIETRPDLICEDSLVLMRRFGCTKVQMGIQSLNRDILKRNKRNVTIAQIERAFALLRLFGFKIHVHFMINLLGSVPEADKNDYLHLVTDEAYLPDEVKLYPCMLVESAHLIKYFESGIWVPYTDEELIDVLAYDMCVTPPYMRISRMIRDISASDIVAGSKKTNLRQLVENRLADEGTKVSEIRRREIATHKVSLEDLALECVSYSTCVSEERFFQWVTPQGAIAGFLRLSLPKIDRAKKMGINAEKLPISDGVAMIREVHVYGKVARLHEHGEDGAQHAGLGRRLVQEACDQAHTAGYSAIDVISSVGTRNYYRKLGFEDEGLYQRKHLGASTGHTTK